MAEFVSTPQELKESGARDLNFLLKDIPSEILTRARLLDVGCGIGRLCYVAADRVQSVLGVDISQRALAIAEVYTETKPNTSFALLDGNGLGNIKGRFDIVISFATLPHLTASDLVTYLCDIFALLEGGGTAFLQLYVGDEHQFPESDTFSLRSYSQANVLRTLSTIGFSEISISSLELPFDGVDRTHNRAPVIIRAKKEAGVAPVTPEVSLLISGETPVVEAERTSIPRDEEGLLLREVNNHLAQHNLKDAHKLLKYLISTTKDAPFEVLEAFEKISEALEEE